MSVPPNASNDENEKLNLEKAVTDERIDSSDKVDEHSLDGGLGSDKDLIDTDKEKTLGLQQSSVAINGDGNVYGNQNTVTRNTTFNVSLDNVSLDSPEAVKKFFSGIFQSGNPNKAKWSKEDDEIRDEFEGTREHKKKKPTGTKRTKSKADELIISPQEWFKNLTENQKLYAMLAVLFRGLDREVLDNLYVMAVANLRKQGLANWFDDARILGINDLLVALSATDENGTIQLPLDYDEEVSRQANNRHHLLWSIIEELFENNEKEISFSDWEFRESLGHAIGRIGIRYPIKLENMLDRFARHPSRKIVVIAGYALAEMVGKEVSESKLYEKILEKWVSSKNPDQSWAAAASIWRIYLAHHNNQPVKDLLWRHLEKLINDIDDLDAKTKNDIIALDQMKDRKHIERLILDLFWGKVSVISDALNHMFDVGPDDVISHLKTWLRSGEHSKQSFISQHAMGKILDRISRPAFHSVESIRWGLGLFPLTLDVDDQDIQDVAFSALRSWFISEALSKDEIQEMVQIVTRLIDKSNSDHLNLLRNGLVEHCFGSNADSNSDLNSIVINLLRRLFLVDGFPILSSRLGNLVLCVDASYSGRESNSLGLTSRIHPVVNSMIETRVFLMGDAKKVGSADKLFKVGSQSIWHDLPRLLPNYSAWHSEAEAGGSICVVALSFGPVINIFDLPDRLPNSPILYLRFFESSDEPTIETPIRAVTHRAETSFEASGWSPVVADMSSFAIEFAIQKNLDVLWQSAPQYNKLRQTGDAVSREILVSFEKMQQGLGTYDDYCAISSMFLWFVKQNNEFAINTCIDWLAKASKSDTFLRLPGLSLGKFILRSCKYLDVSPKTMSKLIFALLNTCADWQSFELILTSIENICRKQSKTIDIDIIDPASLAELIPDKLHSQLLQFIDKWMQDKTIPISLRKFSERLKLFVDVGLFSRPSDISPEQKFGLIFVDGDLTDPQLLKQALEFISKLEKMPLGENVLPVLYRLGQKVPLAVGYGARSLPERIWKYCLPNFLNPILAVYPKDKVSFRAMLIKNLVFDFDDRKQDWSDIPTVVFDLKKQSKQLEGRNLLYLSSYDYYSKNITTPADAVGEALTQMCKLRA